MKVKRKGDTLILVGLILTIIIACFLILIGYVLYSSDYCDKSVIRADIIAGDLKIRDGKTFEESVNYYYEKNLQSAITIIIYGVLFLFKLPFQIYALVSKKKGAYLACIILGVFFGLLFSILTIAGGAMSLSEINKENNSNNGTKKSDAESFVFNNPNSNQNVARTVSEENEVETADGFTEIPNKENNDTEIKSDDNKENEN